MPTRRDLQKSLEFCSPSDNFISKTNQHHHGRSILVFLDDNGGGLKWFFFSILLSAICKKSMNYLVDSCFKRIYFTRGIRVVKHISSFISCVKRAVLHVSTFQDEGVCLLNKHIHWCRVDVLRRRSSSWCVLLGHFLLQNYFFATASFGFQTLQYLRFFNFF